MWQQDSLAAVLAVAMLEVVIVTKYAIDLILMTAVLIFWVYHAFRVRKNYATATTINFLY